MTTRSTTKRQCLWPYWSLLPFGSGAWAVAYAGIRVRCTGLIALGGLLASSVIAGWIVVALHPAPHWEHVLGGSLAVTGWIGAIMTSFVIRPEYERRMGIGPNCDLGPRPRLVCGWFTWRALALVALALLVGGG